MNRFLAISLGAVLGANARYWLGAWLDGRFSTAFPLGTFVINTTGSLVLGFFVVLAAEHVALAPEWRLLVAVGFLGSYTTFSTFSVETWNLIAGGRWQLAIVNVLASVVAGLAGAW
ncbi:MAG TPA: fluoride efflux transporter CrcB, partial [Ardenticatenaceae bacterium]|nr:fluoride efflux transporter CrcB [Ardenticatenaceae bacterium]